MDLTKLQPASFDKVPFSVNAETKTADGRVRILHEYPNSSRRYVEDLGLSLPVFPLDIFVHGEKWLERATSLRQALRKEGPGRLVMPNFGAQTVYALEFTENTTQRNIGVITFAVRFAVGETAIAPAASEKTAEDVYDRGDNARKKIKDGLKDIWGVPTQKPEIIVSQSDTRIALETVESIIYQASTVTKEMKAIIDSISFSLPTLVKNADNYSASLFTEYGDNIGLFQAISTSLNGGRTGLDAALNLSNFGAGLPLTISDVKRSVVDVTLTDTGIPLWPETTAQRILRNNNRKFFVESVRVGALVSAYEQAAVINYSTTDEVKKARSDLGAAYQRIYQDEAQEQESLLSQPDTINALNDVRDASLEVLELKQQQAFKVVDDFDLTSTTALLKAWELYQENFDTSDQLEERADELRNLNSTQSAVDLIGTVKIFQNRAAA